MVSSADKWKAVSAVAIFMLLVVSALYIIGNSDDSRNGYVETDMSLWVDDSYSKDSFIDYLKDVTDEKSENYIPVEDRIAVFDLDGTLVCERDPHYFDLCLFLYRVLEDPDHKDKATELERKVAMDQKDYPGPGKLDADMENARALAFKGMTVEEFYDYVDAFKETPMPSYEGMTYGEAFYRPMLQIVDALQANGFTVYIVSGTDVLTVRGLVDGSMLNIPTNHIIASEKLLVATGQGDEDGSKYVLMDDDDIMYGGVHIMKDLNVNKVVTIIEHIGKKPVLSFGNTSSDSSMATFTTVDNKYRSEAYMLCCDDLVRENGDLEAAAKMYKLCVDHGWIPVSMKNDWTTIYGDDVHKK